MRDDKSQISIMRWMNYADAGIEQFERSTQYIFKEKSSPAKYRGSYNLSVSNPSAGLEIIQDRWKPRGNRIFKHGVISFGVRNLLPDKAMDVTNEILQIYNGYPMLYAIHTDIPRRIHAHFIMCMTNVFTGKKFEQDYNEFERFRNHYNETVIKNGLPSLKGYKLNDAEELKTVSTGLVNIQNNIGDNEFLQNDGACINHPYSCESMSFSTPKIQSSDLILNQVFDKYRTDFNMFYNLGRRGF